jgi:hypothetical protein
MLFRTRPDGLTCSKCNRFAEFPAWALGGEHLLRMHGWSRNNECPFCRFGFLAGSAIQKNLQWTLEHRRAEQKQPSAYR